MAMEGNDRSNLIADRSPHYVRDDNYLYARNDKKNKFAMTIAMANEVDSLLKQGNKLLFYFILLEIRSGIQDVHSNNAGLRHLEQRHLISLRHHQKNRL